jgi:hypothetical protein
MRECCPHSRNRCPGGIVRRPELRHEHLDTHPDHYVSVALRGGGRCRTGRGTPRRRRSTRSSTFRCRPRTDTPPPQRPITDMQRSRDRCARPTDRAGRSADSPGATCGCARHSPDTAFAGLRPGIGSPGRRRIAGPIAGPSVRLRETMRRSADRRAGDRAAARAGARACSGPGDDPRPRFRPRTAAGNRSESGSSARDRDHGASGRRKWVGSGTPRSLPGDVAVAGRAAACADTTTAPLSPRCSTGSPPASR